MDFIFCPDHDYERVGDDGVDRLPAAVGLEVARFRFLRIAIPVPWRILEELEPELES